MSTTDRQLNALGAVGAIACSSSPVRDRIEDVVYTFREVVPWVAYHVGYRTPEGMTTIVSNGYEDRTQNHLESVSWLDEADAIVATGPNALAYSVRQCDLADPDASETVSNFLRPAGYFDGVSCLLQDADQQQVQGVVNLSAEASGTVTDEARQTLDIAGSLIQNLLAEYQLSATTHATYIIDEAGQLWFSAGPSEFRDPDLKDTISQLFANRTIEPPPKLRLPYGDGEVLLGVTQVRYFGGRKAHAVITAEHAAPLPITDREIEVVRLLASGRTNPQIAAELHVSRRTVATHIEHILVRLGLTNRTEVAVWACQHGLLAGPHQ